MNASRASVLRPWLCLLVLASLIALWPARLSAQETPRLVVVLYPQNNDGSPGGFLVDQAIRTELISKSPTPVEIYNEYLDTSRPGRTVDDELQRNYLRTKYAQRKVDVVIAGLSTALDYALANRDVFPGAPLVACAVDERELQRRTLPRDVVGVPIRFDLERSLNLALQLHPQTETVAVIAGTGVMDIAWTAEARRTFAPYEPRRKFAWLTGLAMNDLLQQVRSLNDRTVIYYLHVFQDADGQVLVPADVLERVSKVSPVPIYGNVDTYVGRGIVGGRVFSFGREGRNAAGLALRLMAGERAEQIGLLPVSPNEYQFDARQLQRFGISRSALPKESVIRFDRPGFWDQYAWHVASAAAFCAVQSLLIVGLLVQRAKRKRAEQTFRRAIDEAPVGMLLIDQAGRIVLANRQCQRIFGYSKEALVGQPVEILLPESVRALHRPGLMAYLQQPVAQTMGAGRELVGCRQDGTSMPIEIGLSPVEVGSVRYVLASVIDITERKQAVADLHESQAELRQLSGSLIDAQETERRRIARELHDDFSQSLALLSIQIDMLKQSPGSPPELAGRVDSVSKRVKTLSTAIHTLSHELHPLKLEQLGLVAAVRGLCQELAENHDLRVQFESRGSIDKVPAEAALCLYRIAQEALRNVIKHSGSRSAAVALDSTAEHLVLRVSDHGRGFDSASKDGRGGLGLLSMRERLRLVGGELCIDSQACGGTRVEGRIPKPAPLPDKLTQASTPQPLAEVAG